MNRQNILRITLFISVLAFNPAVAQTLNQRTLSLLETQEQKTLGSDIADTLVQRGLEKEAAQSLSQKFISMHAGSLEKMVQNIVGSGMVSHSEVIAYLSDAALFRREADFSSYDALVHMMTHIGNSTPSKETLSALRTVAVENSSLKA